MSFAAWSALIYVGSEACALCDDRAVRPRQRRMTRSWAMGFDQYHEPPGELPEQTRTFARMITSLIEEAEAISWYEQRMAVEKDAQARAIMDNAEGRIQAFRYGSGVFAAPEA